MEDSEPVKQIPLSDMQQRMYDSWTLVKEHGEDDAGNPLFAAYLKIDHQYFRIQPYEDSRAQAEWYCKMLAKALPRLVEKETLGASHE